MFVFYMSDGPDKSRAAPFAPLPTAVSFNFI
jgi:hypothetical protein